MVYVQGSGRYHASRTFGIGAEASEFGYAIVYPERNVARFPVIYLNGSEDGLDLERQRELANHL